MKVALNSKVAAATGALVLVVAFSSIFDLTRIFDPSGYKARLAAEQDAHESLQEAIECAYYRCAEGCNSDKISGICREMFCNGKFYEDDEGRICGKNAVGLAVETLRSVKTARIKSVSDDANFKLENRDGDLADICFVRGNNNDCDFNDNRVYGSSEHMVLEIQQSKLDGILIKIPFIGGSCHGLDGGQVRLNADKLHIWAVKQDNQDAKVGLKACGTKPVECVESREGLERCEGRDEGECRLTNSGCEWDNDSSPKCKPINVGQGLGPTPCTLFDKASCTSQPGCILSGYDFPLS